MLSYWKFLLKFLDFKNTHVSVRKRLVIISENETKLQYKKIMLNATDSLYCCEGCKQHWQIFIKA